MERLEAWEPDLVRVLLLTNLFPPDYDGGYELNAWKVANGLRERGHEVEVVTSEFRPGYRGERTEPDWVHRILVNRPNLPPSEWKMPWVRLPMLSRLVHHESIAWLNVPRLQRFLQGRLYDLVYIFGLHDVGLGCAYVPQQMELPVLWHFGDHYVADHQARYTYSPLFNLTGRTILNSVRVRESRIRFRYAAFVSRFLQDYFAEKGVRPDNAYVIPRGVEFPLQEDLDRERSSPPTFLLASRLTRDKGLHVAIEAARELATKRPELTWRLQITGKGEEAYEQSLREQAAPLGGKVEFLGRLDRAQVLEHMRSASAFISSSIWGEPFANTIIEALASGTPLIGSDAGSILEVVQPDRTALIYPRESSSDLAACMERIITEPALGRSLAEAGLVRIKEAYTLDAILDQTEIVMGLVVGGSVGQ